MGFGSYDESEQDNHTVSLTDTDTDPDELDTDRHDGELTFEPGESTDALLDRLEQIKQRD